jgi:hypothetical protein
MECNKWQEEGLLYVSKEMTASRASEYLKHVQVCDVCRVEIDQYFIDKKSLFSANMLCESPSDEINKKIIAACSFVPKASRTIPLFSTVWFKRAVISMVFLVFGTSAGIYFTMNYYDATTKSNALASHKSIAPAAPSVDRVALGSLEKSRDSAAADKKDSLKQKENVPYINHTQSGASQQGIVTVDLKKE